LDETERMLVHLIVFGSMHDGMRSVAKERDKDNDWDRHAEKKKQNGTHGKLLDIRFLSVIQPA
jgi:hypothetical protein